LLIVPVGLYVVVLLTRGEFKLAHTRALGLAERHASIAATVSRRRSAPDACRPSVRQENYAEQDAGGQRNDRCGTASFLDVNHHFFLPRHSYSARRCRILLVATTCVNQPKVSVIPGLKYWNMRLDSFHNAERCDVQDGLTHATARQECGPTILAVASFQLLGLQSANIPLLINCHLSFG
jgi:hypothetical protein